MISGKSRPLNIPPNPNIIIKNSTGKIQEFLILSPLHEFGSFFLIRTRVNYITVRMALKRALLTYFKANFYSEMKTMELR